MSLGAAELVLEIAAGHLLPTLAFEVGRYAFRHAADRPSPSAQNRPAKPWLEATARPRRARAAGHLHLVPRRGGCTTPVQVIAHVPGRVRLRVPGLQGSRYRAEEIEASVYDVLGVKDVQVNALTGTALVEYEPRSTTVAEIVGAVEQASEPGREMRAIPRRGRPIAVTTRHPRQQGPSRTAKERADHAAQPRLLGI